MRRSAIPVAPAARRATSCSACFLLPTRSWAMTLRGVSSSEISITLRFPAFQPFGHAVRAPRVVARTGQGSLSCALAANTFGPMRVTAVGPKGGVDPADIAVAPPVNEVQLTMRPVAEQQHRDIGQIHPHDRFADGETR